MMLRCKCAEHSTLSLFRDYFSSLHCKFGELYSGDGRREYDELYPERFFQPLTSLTVTTLSYITGSSLGSLYAGYELRIG